MRLFFLHPNKAFAMTPKNLLLALGIISLCTLIYSLGTEGPLLHDDFSNIVRNPALAKPLDNFDNVVAVYESGNAGPTKRPVAVFSFAASYHPDLAQWSKNIKTTSIALHAAISLFLFLFLFELGRTPFLRCTSKPTLLFPLIATAWWTLNPSHVSTVLYAVQQMTVWSCLFCIAALWWYTRQRNRMPTKHWQRAPAIILFAFLAVFSKEMGILLIAYIALIEFIFFHSIQQQKTSIAQWTIGISGILAVCLVPILFALNHESYIATYDFRPFSLVERLLTQPRFLFHYIGQFYIPYAPNYALIHDTLTLSKSILEPTTTLLSILAWPTIIGLGIKMRKKFPLECLGILIFIAGHSLESSALPLELFYEHRNYMPSIGLTILLSSVACRCITAFRISKIAIIALLVFCTFQLFIRVSVWSSSTSFFTSQIHHHPDSPAAQSNMGSFYAGLINLDHKYIDKALQHYDQAIQLNPRFNSFFGLAHMWMIHRDEILEHSHYKTPDRMPHQSDFLAALSSDTIPHTLHARFYLINVCLNEQRCKDHNNLMESLYAAILNRNDLTPIRRAEILYQHSSWHWKAKRYNEALVSAAEAANIEPDNYGYQFNVIQQLIGTGQFDAARYAIERLNSNNMTISDKERFLNIVESLPNDRPPEK